MKKIYYSVCVEVFLFFSFRVLGVRGDLIQNAENYCYELSVFLFFFFKDFTSIVIHHLILLISSAVKCMQTVKALEYEQKAL